MSGEFGKMKGVVMPLVEVINPESLLLARPIDAYRIVSMSSPVLRWSSRGSKKSPVPLEIRTLKVEVVTGNAIFRDQ